MKKSISKILIATLMIATFGTNASILAGNLSTSNASYESDVTERVIQTGVTEDGIPYTVIEVSTTIINSRTRAVMRVDVKRTVWFTFSSQSLAQSFKAPRTMAWREDIGGNGEFQGTLEFTMQFWNAGNPRAVEAHYEGTLVGQS